MTNPTTTNTKQDDLDKEIVNLLELFGRRYYEYHTDQDHLDDGVSEYSVKFEQLLTDTVNKVLDEVIEALPDTAFHGTSIRVKQNIEDNGYVNGVHDSRSAIEKVRKEWL